MNSIQFNNDENYHPQRRRHHHHTLSPLSSKIISMTPQQPLFHCHFPGCGLSYRRKEHLTRHAKSHFQAQSYGCPFCSRVFARNDTLRQHVRTNHKNKELQSCRAVQACEFCRLRRSRCNGQRPCDACSQRGIQCSYSQNPRRRALEQRLSGPDSHMNSTASKKAGCTYSTYSSVAGSSFLQRMEAIENSPCEIVPYVEAYFEKFHPKWPFLHPATFDADHEPAFFLQSVVMVGLWVTGESNMQQTAKYLHQKLTSSIYEQKVSYIFSFHFCLLYNIFISSATGKMGHIESPQ